MGNFFCWLAGAHLRTLRRAPTERGFYVALGASLLVPFTLGVAGSAVVGHVVTDRPAVDLRLLAVALVWGCLIVVVDRLLLTVRMDAGSGRGAKALFNAMRVCLALGTAVVVTEPLLSVWFGDEAIAEARTELGTDKTQDRERISRDYDKRRADVAAAAAPRQRQIEAEITRLQQQIDAANRDAAEARGLCDAELGGRNGGDRGDGPQASRLCRFAEQADAQATAASDTGNARIGDLQKELIDLRAPLEGLGKDQNDALATVDARRIELDDIGLWRRIELTHKVLSWWWLLALAGTLVVLDTMPVVLKALRGPTAYDELLKTTRDELATVTKIVSNTRVDAASDARQEAAVERAHLAVLRAEQRRLEAAAARARADAGIGVADVHVDALRPIDWSRLDVDPAHYRPEVSRDVAGGDDGERRTHRPRRRALRRSATGAAAVLALSASVVAAARVIDTEPVRGAAPHPDQRTATVRASAALSPAERCARVEADTAVRRFVDAFPGFVVGESDARNVMASVRGSLAKPFVGTPAPVRDAAGRLADELTLILRHSKPDVALAEVDASRLVAQVGQVSALLEESCRA